MAQGDKSAFYQALKRAGYEFDKHYRDYTTDELQTLAKGLDLNVQAPVPKDALPPRPDEVAELREQLAQVTSTVTALGELLLAERAAKQPPAAPAPTGGPVPAKPEEYAGVTADTTTADGVIEVDAYGNEWYQREVTKPASPRPRGRRVLRYNDPGVKTEQIKVGDYVETFEVAGDGTQTRPSEITVTLPSFQTGIYKQPNMPFKIHTYNGKRGFDLFEVQAYFGGADLVPDTVKRTYVSNDLCYDIQSTVRTIENLYREHVLGKAALTK